jgi:hypothetical protein
VKQQMLFTQENDEEAIQYPPPTAQSYRRIKTEVNSSLPSPQAKGMRV